MTASSELRAAATKLRSPLPVHVRPEPFLVITDEGCLDGIAFCEAHPVGKHWQDSACIECEVIETKSEKLAELILALLQGRAAQATALDVTADFWDTLDPHLDASHEHDETAVGHHLLLIARQINGGTA